EYFPSPVSLPTHFRSSLLLCSDRGDRRIFFGGILRTRHTKKKSGDAKRGLGRTAKRDSLAIGIAEALSFFLNFQGTNNGPTATTPRQDSIFRIHGCSTEIQVGTAEKEKKYSGSAVDASHYIGGKVGDQSHCEISAREAFQEQGRRAVEASETQRERSPTLVFSGCGIAGTCKGEELRLRPTNCRAS